MAEFRTIEIDFDVHKRIEAERRGFAELPNTVLRRLLGLDESKSGTMSKMPGGGRSWASKGVLLPHGTDVRMEYNGRVYAGVIEDGSWIVEGGKYKSPSAAAGGVARTKDGGRTSLDGWIYWQVKRPGDTNWTAIRYLRAAAEKSR
jgi:hypothetical protein